jgi:hypothetical protein
MIPERFARPIKIIAALVAIIYSGMIYVSIIETVQWLAITGILLIVLLLVVYLLDYPFTAIWPIFPGSFLIIGASVALYQGLPTPGPLTQTRGELVIACLVGILYVIWGVRSTRRALSFMI